MNVFGYDPRAGSEHAHIVDTTVAYTEPETDQVAILLINQVIEMKGLTHHLLCPMQCMNAVLIDEVTKFMAPLPSYTPHVIKTENPFNATHPVIILLKLNTVRSFIGPHTEL